MAWFQRASVAGLLIAGALAITAGCDQHIESPAERGKILFQRGQWQESIKACSEALEVGPDPNAYIYRGRSFQCLGDLDRAIYDFSYAIRFDPKNSEAYYLRALAYEAQGDKKHAAADRALAHQLDPEFAQLQVTEIKPPQFVPDEPKTAKEPEKEDFSSAKVQPFDTSDMIHKHASGDLFGRSAAAPAAAPPARDVFGQPVGNGVDRAGMGLTSRSEEQGETSPRDARGTPSTGAPRGNTGSTPGGLAADNRAGQEDAPENAPNPTPPSARYSGSPYAINGQPGGNQPASSGRYSGSPYSIGSGYSGSPYSAGERYSAGRSTLINPYSSNPYPLGGSGALGGNQSNAAAPPAPRQYGVAPMRSTGIHSQPEVDPNARPTTSRYAAPASVLPPAGDRPDLRPQP